MIDITAPYRFVRTHNKIFYPSWGQKQGKDISFDMPYMDSQSGQINITITAKSPIFVGNGTNKNKDDTKNNKNDKPQEFFNHNGTYYIPGSSIKGMIRTIATILSFSKMSLDDKTLSCRDINNPAYKKKAMKQNQTFIGWLYVKSKKWYIDEIGELTKEHKISYEKLEQLFGKSLIANLKTKQAHAKYELLQHKNLHLKEGTIVLTGFFGKKKNEFIFPHTITQTHNLTNEQVKTFQEAYYIGTPNESKDWTKRWKQEIKQGKKVPIFFQKTQNNQIRHFGLSMLYKLPYDNSTQALYTRSLTNYNKSYLDCVDRIFGFVRDDTQSHENKALKGRISFSHFKAQGSPKSFAKQSLILSTPRPTFYPYYIDQTPNTLFKTYDEKDSKLSGFKFYVPRHNIMNHKGNGNSNILSHIIPLDKGTTFTGTLRYFNLKKEELGLLLLTLTFLQDKHYYKIGGAKPYGFGDCHIKLHTSLNTQEYINAYIDFVKREFGDDPINSQSAKDLLRFSQRMPNDNLDYMELQEFTKLKSENQSKFGKRHSHNGGNNPHRNPHNPKAPKPYSNEKREHTDDSGRFNPLADKFDNQKKR
ncbi:TIGR03986 family CRISPR-associated RAMP protein [Helicobacter cinaedi]|uniref:TIGR03986 family type III CRISPR-associated RAMP protein n=1 Tax=Helicobacter cinaedi TaxID=213 RepID=UPI000CF116F5|nr:TIGR03986 family CRISPR-associated RAMP protein [Helicobacter cinaedi]